jgi:hypothetical protein
VTVAPTPPPGPPRDELLVLRVDHDAEVARALATLQCNHTLRGLHLFHADVDRVWEVFKAGHVFVAAAGGAVTDEHGRLLVIKRLGKWDLPKGKIDPGEGVTDAAFREEPMGALQVLVPQSEEDIEEVRWLTPDEVRAIERDTYPSLLPVFQAWLERG